MSSNMIYVNAVYNKNVLTPHDIESMYFQLYVWNCMVLKMMIGCKFKIGQIIKTRKIQSVFNFSIILILLQLV